MAGFAEALEHLAGLAKFSDTFDGTIGVLVAFVIAVTKCLTKETYGGVYLGSCFEGSVHLPCGEGVNIARGSWSHHIHSQVAEKVEFWDSVSFLIFI